ncbi:hypothetical protein C5S42_12470 [Candidatus Methanomarinus sp.]|nr:hypothetical protein C5S42_12470 [ANME-2 cluster archaeon]
MDTPVDRILFLQRTAGNQAVSRLMKSGALQAKLKIGHPGDKYEQEADRVADAVMRMPEPGVKQQAEEEELIQPKPLAEQIRPLIQRQVEPEKSTSGQAKKSAAILTYSKKISVGSVELPNQEDLNFTIATVLGESSANGPINEKIGIAMVIRNRVESKWDNKLTFRDIILNTGVYGNPSKNALARLAELYLNKTPDTLVKFKKIVDQAHRERVMRHSDRSYLKTGSGFKIFVSKIEQAKMATEFVIEKSTYEPTLAILAKEATWWGGEIDLWDSKACKIWKHGTRVMNNKLVFVVSQEFGKTYFLKETKKISDKNNRNKEITKSKKFLCSELARITACTKKKIIKNNPGCKYLI